MKKISKKICALVLVFGLVLAPVKQANAFSWNPADWDCEKIAGEITFWSSIAVNILTLVHSIFGHNKGVAGDTTAKQR